ncbi:hypothetical protein [Spirosoma daeguense]
MYSETDVAVSPGNSAKVESRVNRLIMKDAEAFNEGNVANNALRIHAD